MWPRSARSSRSIGSGEELLFVGESGGFGTRVDADRSTTTGSDRIC